MSKNQRQGSRTEEKVFRDLNCLLVGIVGVVAVVSPLDVPARIVNFDMIIMAVSALVLMPFMIGNKEVISRPVAGFYLAAYLGYIAAIAAGVENFRS